MQHEWLLPPILEHYPARRQKHLLVHCATKRTDCQRQARTRRPGRHTPRRRTWLMHCGPPALPGKHVFLCIAGLQPLLDILLPPAVCFHGGAQLQRVGRLSSSSSSSQRQAAAPRAERCMQVADAPCRTRHVRCKQAWPQARACAGRQQQAPPLQPAGALHLPAV